MGCKLFLWPGVLADCVFVQDAFVACCARFFFFAVTLGVV